MMQRTTLTQSLADPKSAAPAVLTESPAVVLTYRGLAEQTERLAKQLRCAGLRPGDCIVMVLPNGLEFLVIFLALAQAGLMAAPLNTPTKPMICEFSLKTYNHARSSWLLQKEVAEFFRTHPTARRFTIHEFRGTAMSTAKMAGASYDKAAISFGCHPETKRRHYLVINEVAIFDAVLDRIQRVKSVENCTKRVEKGDGRGAS